MCMTMKKSIYEDSLVYKNDNFVVLMMKSESISLKLHGDVL